MQLNKNQQLYAMEENDFVHRNHLPDIHQRQPSISNVFQLIRQKKHELTRKIEAVQRKDPKASLQNIVPITYNNFQSENIGREERVQMTPTNKSHSRSDQMPQDKAMKTQQYLSPTKNDLPYQSVNMNRLSQQYQLTHIFGNQKEIEKSNTNSQSNKYSDSNKNTKLARLNFSMQNDDPPIRTKTELNDLSERKLTNPSYVGLPGKRMRVVAEERSLLDTMKLAKEKFKGEFQLIPTTNLTPALKLLQVFNPFFNRLQRVISICLLKMSRYVYRQAHTVLYKADEERDHFYVILLGKVRLSNNSSFRRICQSGETILQQMIFSEKGRKMSLQKAKTITATYLLQIKIHDFKKIKEELIRFGYKVGLNEMEAVIKRNHIIKNWMRNKTKEEHYHF